MGLSRGFSAHVACVWAYERWQEIDARVSQDSFGAACRVMGCKFNWYLISFLFLLYILGHFGDRILYTAASNLLLVPFVLAMCRCVCEALLLRYDASGREVIIGSPTRQGHHRREGTIYLCVQLTEEHPPTSRLITPALHEKARAPNLHLQLIDV